MLYWLVVPCAAFLSTVLRNTDICRHISNDCNAIAIETALQSVQEGLNGKESSCAALIPIKKNAEWWAMSQDERRSIFEEQSHHAEIGLAYLPEIARQLHHSRDLGEPFDFITWFEFSSEHTEHTEHFNKLLRELQATKEWQFVECEIDIRLERDA